MKGKKNVDISRGKHPVLRRPSWYEGQARASLETQWSSFFHCMKQFVEHVFERYRQTIDIFLRWGRSQVIANFAFDRLGPCFRMFNLKENTASHWFSAYCFL